jgi:hypothetical protein
MPVDVTLIGRWRGEAQIVVAWAAQRTLPVELLVAPDGGVAGRVGAATLVRGRVRANRGALGRALGIKTDFLVRAELDGEILAGIRRRSVSIPFNLVQGTLRGSVTTDGLEIGPTRWLQFAAARLVLRRVKASPPARRRAERVS